MADPVNPYAPSGLDRLSMLLMSLGSGISGAEASGRSGWAGLGPAAAMYGGAMANANQNAAAWEQQQRQFQSQESYRKAQEDALRSQTATREAEARSKAGMGAAVMAALGGTPGMGMTPPAPTIGPGADLLKEGPQKVAYLTSTYGLTPVQAAGIVGNLYQESGFNPTATHDGGRGYGMAGWDPNRTAGLQRFAQGQGKPISDPQVQMDYLVSEMKGGDMGAQRAYAMLQQAKTPQDATTAMMHFFRPAGYTPSNPAGGHGYQQRVQYAQALMPGGAAPPNATGQGDAGGGAAPAQLDPQTVQMIQAIALKDPEAAAKLVIQARQGLKKEDAYEPLTDANAKMFLGPGYDPNKTYQRNKVSGKIEVISERKKLDAFSPVPVDEARTILGTGYDPNKSYQRNEATGKIEPIGGSLVNINNQQESAFTKQVAEQDAKRLGTIQDNTNSVLDTVAKMRSATDLLSQTYTGPGADYANAWYKALGALGVESARNKADAATAAQAIIAEITPRMRPPGSGATSDFEMATFGRSIVSMLNLPGGNEKVASYWQRIGDRAIAIQDIAEKHALESKRLTGTDFSKEVKALGPIFTKDEIAEMKQLASSKGEQTSPAASSDMPTVKTPDEAMKLPKGTRFRDPMGVIRVVP